MNFRISSMTMTGALMHNTATHSSKLSGVMTNIVYHNNQLKISVGDGNTYGEEWHIKNHEMECHT